MGLKTPRITYNVHDRGRKALGQDRFFDTAVLAKVLNCPETQERVNGGDMLGYYGHWPRLKFGMATQEGGIVNGKAVPLPTAIRTIYLSADDQGNITHQEEFLDTDAGQIAQKLYESKAGGFSSAIDALPKATPSIATAFHGFDYVLTPNYATNRGYEAMLDAVGGSEGLAVATPEMIAMLDEVHAESIGAAAHLVAMFDALQAQHNQALEALEHVSNERDELIGMVAAGKGSAALLDDVMGAERIPAHIGQVRDFEQYRNMPLVRLNEQQPGSGEQARNNARTFRRLGIGQGRG